MKKTKFFYNRHTLKYEKIEETFQKRLFRITGFLTTSIIFAGIMLVFAYLYLDSPKEKQLKREISKLNFEFELANQKLERFEKVLTGLQERDDNIYRVIFESEPIPGSVREAGIGGSNKYGDLKYYQNGDLMIATSTRLDKLSRQLYIQSKSYDEINRLIKNKEEMLASIPAIQPVSNKDLTRIASGFGYRIHPVYKTRKMHHGVDFTAPTGTEIYCTGNGRVIKTQKSKRGYGNHVIIDHGFGYQSIYAHMYDIRVAEGQKVKRGDVLGTVGNTGLSTAPHLHYELVKNGKKIDPINYFYNDLTPEEYEKIIELSARHNQSFD